MLIELTARPMRIGSFTFSLFLTSVTRTFAVAPAGITAPFEPVTASATVAVKVSPTLCVFVQTFWLDARLIVVPEAIIPTAPPPVAAAPPAAAGSLFVTVLPLAVLVGVGVRVVEPLEEVVVRLGGVDAVFVGVAAGVAGTSFSAGCA